MFPFDVILFDVGGVLLTNGWDTGERALAVEHFHLDRRRVRTAHHAVYPAWERGDISIRIAYLDATVFNEPRSFTRRRLFWVHAGAVKARFPTALSESLPNLPHLNKCMLGALNNEARETNEYRFKTVRPAQLLQAGAELVLRGPAQTRRRFIAAPRHSRRPAKRILFIDDRNRKRRRGCGRRA
jgi:putative hydrolase of the HAD superfamily